jgi:hypothetical protein
MAFKPYLAQVTWEDAYHHETGAAEEIEEWQNSYSARVVNSVGWVLRSDKEVIILSAWQMANDDTYRNAMFIPRGMVRKIKRLHGT